MGTEIERKYLVVNDGWRDAVESQKRLEQGYLCDRDNLSVRIRIADDRAMLTIKTGRGISRGEFEYPLPLDDARELLATATSGSSITKTRYRVRNGAHCWDLDVFDGDNQGLVLAEIELNDEGEPFEVPAWAGHEVSSDARYYNVNLVRSPYSSW